MTWTTPWAILSIGSRIPIRPVEQTPTSTAPVSRPEAVSASATSSAVRWASANPGGPVQALAPPEFSTTARSRPSLMTSWVQITGAALTRLPVKTAAAVNSGP